MGWNPGEWRVRTAYVLHTYGQREEDTLWDCVSSDMFDSFAEALTAFEAEKKKHSMGYEIREIMLWERVVFDGSHIEYEDAYGGSKDERGFVRRREWSDCDTEGRNTLPEDMRAGLQPGWWE